MLFYFYLVINFSMECFIDLKENEIVNKLLSFVFLVLIIYVF